MNEAKEQSYPQFPNLGVLIIIKSIAFYDKAD